MIAWAALLFNELALVAMTVLALKRGDHDERVAMSAVLAASIGSQLFSFLGSRWRAGPEYSVWVWDVALLVSLLIIMRRSRKFWPLWAVGAQIQGTLTHGVRWLEPSFSRELYITVQPIWVFPILIAIAVGVFNSNIRRMGN